MSKKIFNVMIAIIGVASIAHVIYTVWSQKVILTALPLWMRISAVLAFWGLILAISLFAFRLISNHYKGR